MSITVKGDFKRKLRRDKTLLGMLVPGFIWYFVFCYLTLFGLCFAFLDYNPVKGIAGSPWVGLKWFIEFFESRYFFRLVRNTIVLNFLSLLISMPAALLYAVFLNEVNDGLFKRSMQTVSYLPHFISVVVLCGMVVNLLAAEAPLGRFLCGLTGSGSSVLSQSKYYRGIYVLSGVWQNLGWDSIIYLSAMSAINTELYEAAYIDGAGRWKRIWHVTLPGLRNTVVILLILSLGGFMNSSFEKTNLLYSPATYETADVISTYVYRVALKGSKYSYGTAIDLFNSLVNILFLLGANFLARRFSDTSLW